MSWQCNECAELLICGLVELQFHTLSETDIVLEAKVVT